MTGNATRHCIGVVGTAAVGADRVRFNSRSFASSSMALAATVVTGVVISDGAGRETTPRYDSTGGGECW